MPQQHLVVQLLGIILLSLALATDLEAVEQLETILTLAILKVLIDHNEFLAVFCKGLHIAVKFPVVHVNRVHISLSGLVDWVDNGVRDFYVHEVLNQVELLPELLVRSDREVAHVLHAEVVRDVGIELAREVSEVPLLLLV